MLNVILESFNVNFFRKSIARMITTTTTTKTTTKREGKGRLTPKK
jgi:hypothetical protein